MQAKSQPDLAGRRGARRELGLMRHARLAFMLVGDNGFCNVE
jgi:hypothetical protein